MGDKAKSTTKQVWNDQEWGDKHAQKYDAMDPEG